MKIETWVLAVAGISASGFFLDWLFKADVRGQERVAIRKFFRDLYITIELTDIGRFQVLVADRTMKLVSDQLGPFGTKSFFKNLFLYSSSATLLFSLCGIVAANFRFGNVTDLLSVVVVEFSDKLHPQESILFLATAIVGNFVFDAFTLAVTVSCLGYVVKNQRLFFFFAAVDAVMSYVFLFCVMFLGSVSSRLFFVPNDLDISYLLSTPQFLFSSLDDYMGTVMLYASVTTFVPVIAYTSALSALSTLKCFQWIFATITARFSEEEADKTFFGWIATALAIVLGVLKLIQKAGAST